MPRGVIDFEALAGEGAKAVRARTTEEDVPFDIKKIGHVVLQVTDLERSVEFYTKMLGFRVSDYYPDTMMDGGMVFLRCNEDHHGVALVGATDRPSDSASMHHMAFEVATIDKVLKARAYLQNPGYKSLSKGGAALVPGSRWRSATRTGIGRNSAGAWIRSEKTARSGRRKNGARSSAWKRRWIMRRPARIPLWSIPPSGSFSTLLKI
ncbi:MAG: VOC family protein [Rhodospirillaceae bacterium]|nr:VOC family protein [Rhodospirillaceae bacterium]